MDLPFVVVLRQLAAARLRQAAWSAAGVLALMVFGLVAIGLAVAAGVVATAERLGVIEALLAWSGGLTVMILVALLGQMLARRRRRLRTVEGAGTAPIGDPGAMLPSDIAFRAGMSASSTLPPLALLAVAFVIGTIVSRGGRR